LERGKRGESASSLRSREKKTHSSGKKVSLAEGKRRKTKVGKTLDVPQKRADFYSPS